MKKVIIGLVAVGAIFALRSAAGRGGQKMREHCMKMAGKCTQMMAGPTGEHGEMREHCKEMMAAHKGHGDEGSERSEREAPWRDRLSPDHRVTGCALIAVAPSGRGPCAGVSERSVLRCHR